MKNLRLLGLCAILALGGALGGALDRSSANMLMGKTSGGGGGGYHGPGDLVPTWTAWYGLRGFSAAFATPGTGKAVQLVRLIGGATQDIVILSSGDLDVATATTFCSTTCGINIFYDQSGNGNDLDVSTRPSFGFSVLGAHPAGQFNGTTEYIRSTNTVTVAQPFTMYAVANRTSGTGYQAALITLNINGFIGFANSANNAAFLTLGGEIDKAATDGTTHSLIGVANAASSILTVDGADQAGSVVTSSGISAENLYMGAAASVTDIFAGNLFEAGLAPSLISGRPALASQAQAYWGY